MAQIHVYIKRAMRRKGMTQRQLAAAADVSPNTVSDWLKGMRKPRPETLAKLAPALDEPYNALMQAAGYYEKGSDIAREPTIAEMSAEELAELIERMQAMLAEALARVRPGPNTPAPC